MVASQSQNVVIQNAKNADTNGDTNNMTKPKLIGLGYRARSGKDTVAQHLVRTHGYRRVGLADKLKDIAGILTGDDAYAEDFKTSVTRFGITGGQLLQQLGHGMRGILPDIWTTAADSSWLIKTGRHVVISDVRYLSDAEHIKNLGGVLWRIDRPGLPQDPHVSETQGAQIKWDAVIVNNSTLPALFSAVDAVLEGLPPVNVVD